MPTTYSSDQLMTMFLNMSSTEKDAFLTAIQGGLSIGDLASGSFGVAGGTVGLYGVTPVTRAAAITSPTAPSAGYVQAEAASMKTAVDAIRVALTNVGITL